MVKKTVELEVNTNLEPTINNLRELKRQLKDAAAGSSDFNRLSGSIRDMEDSISDAKSTGDDFFGQLENAPGILGSLGQGIRGAERTFSSFNGALKASVIGIFAGLLAGLVAAFSNNEAAMKKLQPVLDLVDKTFQGVYRAVEPLFDIFLDLAMKALPAVSKGIGIVYSAMMGYFTFLKEAGAGVMSILKGIFTLDVDAISQGIDKVGGSFKKTQQAYTDSMKRFSEGSKELTTKEKEELAEREKNEKEAADKRKAAEEKRLQNLKEHNQKLKEERKKEAEEEAAFQLDKKEFLNKLDSDAFAERMLKAKENDAKQKQENLLLSLEEASAAAEIANEDKNNRIITFENEKAQSDAKQAISDIETAKKINNSRKVAQSLDQLSAIAGKNTAVSKGLAIASATINTYAGVTEALAAKSTLPSPFDVVAKVANVATIIASGFQAVKSIVAVKVPGSAGGGGGAPASAPSIGAPALNVVGTSPTQILSQQISNQQQQPIKAYVVANDVTTQQSLDRNIVQSSSIG
jgi:chemotaxis protein histidine kinase CheA